MVWYGTIPYHHIILGRLHLHSIIPIYTHTICVYRVRAFPGGPCAHVTSALFVTHINPTIPLPPAHIHSYVRAILSDFFTPSSKVGPYHSTARACFLLSAFCGCSRVDMTIQSTCFPQLLRARRFPPPPITAAAVASPVSEPSNLQALHP